ncbi:MAG TPA: PAS-domain containing protein [Dongiaceae bacterium]|nr:PAS-domain containing protein [Dongiaceae bacterium]
MLRQRVTLGSRSLPYLAAVAGGAFAYFLAAELGLKLASLHEAASPVWPASGLAVAMINLFGRRLWPAIALGAFSANALIGEVWVALPIAIGNTLEGVVGGHILTTLLKRESTAFPLARSTGYLLAAVLGAIISASTGVTALSLSGSLPTDVAGNVWLTWWIGDAIGILIVAPVLTTIGRPSRPSLQITLGHLVKLSGLLCAVAAVLALTSLEPRAAAAVFLAFLTILLSRRAFGSMAGIGTVVLFAIGLIGQVIVGIGPFATASLNEGLLTLQIFLAALAVSALVFADLKDLGLRVPALAFLAACVFGAGVFAMSDRKADTIDELHLRRIVDAGTARIRERMEVYLSLLRGGRALFAASERVARDEWRVYAESLDFAALYPGIKGIGVIWPVQQAKLAEYLAAARADGFADFDLKSVPGVTNPRAADEDHLVITFVEPFSRNRQALGLDMTSEAVRRSGALAARDTGQPAMSGRIALVQDDQQRAGFLLFLPFYDTIMPPADIEGRRRHFRGLIYAPFVTETFVGEALQSLSGAVDVTIYDGAVADPAAVIMDTAPGALDRPSDVATVTEPITLADRVLTVIWRTGPTFEYESRWPGTLMSVGLVLLGTLLAALIANLQSLRSRANAIAVDMTRALAASNARMNDAINVMGSGFAMFDADDRLIMHNEGFVDDGTRRAFPDLKGTSYEAIMRFFAHAEITAVDALPDREKWLQWRMNMHRHPPVEPLEIEWTDGRWMRVLERRTAEGGTVATWTDVTHIKLAEERLRAAVNAMQDGFGLFDADDRIILHNAGFLGEGSRKVFGDDVTGRKFEEIVRVFAYRDMPVDDPEFDRESWIDWRMEQHRNPPPAPIEVKWSGNRWMRISERRTPDGGYVGIWTDISAVKLAEERLRTAIDAMDSGFALFDADDRLIIHNQGFIDKSVADSFGGDARGRSFEEIIRAFSANDVTAVDAGSDPEAWIERRIRRHRDPPAEPFDQQLTNGTWCRISERRTSDGGYVGIWTDITGLKLAETRLTDAIENINEAFVLIDAEDRYVIYNRHFLDMYPKSGRLVRPGAKFEDVLRCAAEQGEYPGIDTPEQIDAFVQHWVDFYARRQPYVGERQLADGRWVLVSHRPTSNGGYVSVRTDITAQKQREAELQSAKEDLEVRSANLVALAEELDAARNAANEANRGKSQFLANMSHELRTPLNAINGFSEILVKGLFGPLQPVKYQEYAELINQSGQHLLSLINDVLDISKIEAGKMDLHVEALPTEQVAYASMAGVRTMASERGVELKTSIANNCPVMHADPRAVKQVMLNLLSNAVKFTPSAGTVTLAISCNDNGVEITVKDTGIGMTADETEKALELYGQVQSDLAKKQAGTGLGLPLVKSLIELHGGRFKLDSEKGKGTMVSALFPWNPSLPSRLA